MLVVLQRVHASAPDVPESVIRDVEAAVRAEYGGLRVRIPKRKKHPTPAQRKAVVRDARSTDSDEEITRRHGVSRASLYRYLKRQD